MTGAPFNSHGKPPTVAILTLPRIALTTTTWWGHRTLGATIGTVAASAALTATRLTTVKQPWVIGSVAVKFSRIVLRFNSLAEARLRHLRLQLRSPQAARRLHRLLRPRNRHLSPSPNPSPSLSLKRNQHHDHNQSQLQPQFLREAAPALESLVWILRTAVRNGAFVGRAAITATTNQLGRELVALRLPKALARGSLAVTFRIADRGGVIVVRVPRIAMQSRFGLHKAALPSLRIDVKSRPAVCNIVFLEPVSFRQTTTSRSTTAYLLTSCKLRCASLYRTE